MRRPRVSPSLMRLSETKKGEIMTRKDYELIAKAVKDSMNIESLGNKTSDLTDRQVAIIGLAETLSIRLQEDNARFDSERFLKACGLNA